MKSTGIVRKIDDLGRIVLPIELRRSMAINIKDAVEIFTDNDMIILKKFHCSCVFCNSGEDIVQYKDKSICSKCFAELRNEEK